MNISQLQPRLRAGGELIERLIPIVVLVILVTTAYAMFRWVPYYGFFYNANGYITGVYSSPSPFQQDDHLEQVWNVTWDDFKHQLRLPILPPVSAGDVVPIVIDRAGERLQFDYVVPEPTDQEFLDRLVDVWPVPFSFWAAGTLILLLARPKDTTWRLLIAFNYVTALWISAGTLSNSHLWNSSVWLHTLMFLAVPVYLHLHLIFPTPLIQRSQWPLWFLYGVSGLLAVAQWLEWLPTSSYLYAFVVAVLGSLALLIARYIFRPSERNAIGFMTRALLLAAMPVVVLVIYGIVTGLTTLAGGSVLFLPGLPFAYAYAIYRRRLGGLEVRVNRAVSIYAFCTLVGLALLLTTPVLATQISDDVDWTLLNLAAALIILLVTLFGFNPFQQFVERRILGIRIPPTQLLESYAAEITTTLDTQQLIGYLRDDVAASLLIRESALVRLEGGRLLPLYLHTVPEPDLPTDPAALAGRVGRYLPHEIEPGWIRLSLPLTIETQVIGYWLLGRRDPDDYYSTHDISVLATIANQTAIALHNILQTERLHGLYQNDIERNEAGRAALARELHDQVLNELGLLWRSASQVEGSAQMEESFQRLSSSLRQTITGLRPAAVDFGLRLAFADLVDRVSNNGSTAAVELLLGESEPDYQRHEAHVELHLYRIVQQALANALQYAQASRIVIQGTLHTESIDLEVVDDGVGFETGSDPDVAQLVARKHFGIAGMVERAHLIGAQIQVQSAPGKGTCVKVTWRALGNAPNPQT